MARVLLSPVLLALYVFLACGLYVHFRGKVRHKLRRQLLDHSTFTAPYNVFVYLFSAVPRTPTLDLAAFPALAPLKESWRTIREEAKRLFEAGHLRAAEKHNDIAFNSFFRRGWKRFYLKWYGEFLPSAKELCPQTVKLVESIPSVNAALFALLPPHSKLGAHRDPFAGSLRYHLGLLTPNSDDCRIYIDGGPYSWRDGEAVLFDETYVHSARNDTDEPRVILFCDVARPLKTPVARAVNRFVSRHMVKWTATQNVPTEKVGFVNRFASKVFAIRTLGQRLKRFNRPLYYTVEYGLVLGILYLVVRYGVL